MPPASLDIALIPLDRIVIVERLRPTDEHHVALIAASMAETGQHTPIQVGPADDRGFHRLIAGAHRCAALRLAGIPTAQAVVFEGTQLQHQLLEIDENLMRHELTELDRAVFLAKRKALYLALNPEAGRGKAPKSSKSDKSVALPPSFAEETARRIGLSRRQIERAVARAAVAVDAERLRGTRWADNGAVLDALVKAKPMDRAQLIAALTRHNAPAKSFAAARAEVLGARDGAESPDDRQLRALERAWCTAGGEARGRFAVFVLAAAPARELFAEELARAAARAGETG